MADGTDEAYEAFAGLYAQTPLGLLARDWLDRHLRMVAWNNAVLLNTAAGYRAFLAQFPDSDLTATARKLEERLRNRPEFAPAVAAANAAVPQNAALAGPTCPCNVQPPLQPQKVNAPVKRVDPDPPKRADRKPPRRAPPEDDEVVVVRRAPPPVVYEPAGPPVGIGIGMVSVEAAATVAAAITAVADMAAGVDTEASNRVIDPASVALRLRGSMANLFRLFAVFVGICLLIPLHAFAWEHWGGDRGGSRFSPLTQITPANVGSLVRAWEFRTGDLGRRAPEVMARTKFQTTPLFVEDSLIFCSPFNEVIALDPGSGAQKWRYDPKISTSQRPANRYNCRGVAYWVDDGRPKAPPAVPDIHGHQRRPRHRARCEDRHSLRRFRRPMARSGSRPACRCYGRANSRSRRAPVVSRGVVIVGSSIADNRPRRCAARHGARLRCADRAAALELRSAGARRHHRRPRQCLGADVGG